MNIHNHFQKTNFLLGSPEWKLGPIYLKDVNIPGVNFSHPETGARFGSRMHVQSDALQFNQLSCTMIIDENLEIYKELVTRIFTSVNQTSGQFASREFPIWIQINNNKGHKVLTLNFVNCKIESIGDIQLTSEDDMPSTEMTADFVYDYFELVDNPDIDEFFGTSDTTDETNAI